MEATTPTFSFESTTVKADDPRFAEDNKLYIEFYRSPFLQSGKSQQEGRAIYEERDCIRIHVPGDKLTVIERPLDEIDRVRFADRYAKWRAGQEEAVVGTPLAALPGMNPAKVEEYKFYKIVTVEQLAGAPDVIGQKFMGFQSDKQRAKAFLEVAAGNAPIEKLQNEIDAERNARLEAAVALEQVQAELAALKSAMGKKTKQAEAADA
jgi:hypothetical protein